MKDPKAVPQLTTILQRGTWLAQVAAANAVSQIAADSKISVKALSDALIKAGQSDVRQVQEACDKALRALTKAS